MQIWVDADACPGVIKEILYRAAQRTRIVTTLVANQMLRVPPSPYIRSRQVPSGFDVADQRIVHQLQPGDLVVTADIPLAAQVIELRAHALNPRGEFFTTENISERLTMRNFMEELRGSGVDISGPAAFSQGDRQAFAAQLDRFLARQPQPSTTTDARVSRPRA
ncbi:MAG: YaiI/YqxD family protein [Candidatus Accumulibacter sp.]|nr:YaiI/YqxD family protein [Accumulibacter sp.]MCB1943789.1 YaiI/YqxD family protein [Accumulibacter sp.]